MESHFEKILFMQIYTYISLIETTDYYFKIRIYVPIIYNSGKIYWTYMSGAVA